MTKREVIGKIRIHAERDYTISDGALRLLYRLCSDIFTNPRATLEKPFPLPWSKAAVWCGGLKDDKSASRRIAELEDAGYLKFAGLRGCPPIRHFFLIPNCPSRGAIDYGSRGAINSGSRGADHISNSFQEEKIKVKRGENGSLRSTETRLKELAAAPRRFLTADERKELFDAAVAKEGLKK